MIASSDWFATPLLCSEVTFSNNDLKKVRALGVNATAALRGMNFLLRLPFRGLLGLLDGLSPIPPLNGDDRTEADAE